MADRMARKRLSLAARSHISKKISGSAPRTERQNRALELSIPYSLTLNSVVYPSTESRILYYQKSARGDRLFPSLTGTSVERLGAWRRGLECRRSAVAERRSLRRK